MTDADGRDLSLVFLIDALGYEIVDSGGFLGALAATQRPAVRSVLGFSSAAIPTILTGKTPSEHGRLVMYRRRERTSVFDRYRTLLHVTGRLPRGHSRFRRWLSSRLRADGVTGYFSLYEIPLQLLPLFDLCERKSIYAPGAFDGVASLFDRLAGEGVAYRVWDWSVPTSRAFAEMEDAARNGSERMLFLYTPELDATIHVHGPRSAAVAAWLRIHEDAIGRVVRAAKGAGRKPRLRVFGDHGMAQIGAHADLARDLRRMTSKMPRDYIVFLDSTMARFWFARDSVRREITDRLAARSDGRFLTREELSSLGAYFPDRRFGEEIFLVDSGVLILPSFMGSSPIQGMHGYHPDERDSHTTLLADPFPETAPTKISDFAGLLLGDLGLTLETA